MPRHSLSIPGLGALGTSLKPLALSILILVSAPAAADLFQDSLFPAGAEHQDTSTETSAAPSAPPAPEEQAAAPEVLPSPPAAAENTTPPAVEDQSAPLLAGETDNLWSRLRAGFALGELSSPLVTEYENRFADGDLLEGIAAVRGKRYFYYIVDEVERRDMPLEIALIPIIESHLDPTVSSPSQAAGLWQFLPGTAKNFGLKLDRAYDGRRDIIASTDAALDYLAYLHDMFEDWELAIAAYNGGEGTVSRALAKVADGNNNWEVPDLDLPKQTREYLPKLIALRNIIRSPETYGVALDPLPNRPYFARVKTPGEIDMRLAARLADVDVDEIRALNPGCLRVTSRGKGLLLPHDAADRFRANLASNDLPLSGWATHTPRSGTSLASVAEKLGLSEKDLRHFNGLSETTTLTDGRPLLVPANHAEETMESSGATLYTVRAGDTLFGLGRRFHVGAADLKRWNSLTANRLKPGMRLAIHTPGRAEETPSRTEKASVRSTKAAGGKTHYVVRKGDTLSGIAKRFNVAVNDLRRWNAGLPPKLRPGTHLTIFATGEG